MDRFYVCSYGIVNCPMCRPLTVRGDWRALAGRVATWDDRYDPGLLTGDALLRLLADTYGRDAITVTDDISDRWLVYDERWSNDGTLDLVRSWARPSADDVMADAAREREADDVRRALAAARAHDRVYGSGTEPDTVLLDAMLGADTLARGGRGPGG